MPGCGKSTIGVLLAKALGRPFVDTDLMIQQEENRLLQEIIDRDGIKVFLDIEERVVAGLDAGRSIIATGGSVVYGKKAMEHLKEIGWVVYLQLEYEEVESRIKNMKSRGIAIGKGQTLMDLYRERIPLYEKYQDMTVECSGKDIEETVSLLKERLQKQVRPY